MFSITTIASSTTKPVATVSAISDRLSRLKPKAYMIASAPTSDNGTDRLGMIVAGNVAQEQEDHQDHEADRERELELDVLDRGAYGRRAVGQRLRA